MTANEVEIKSGAAVSKDGTNIGYKFFGQGPKLLIVHGGFRASQHYLELGKHLADEFTVYIMDRRGRNSSGPTGPGYTFQKEVDDVHAMMEQNEISLLFGHSFGAFSSLNAAIGYPPAKKLAVYETPLVRHFPVGWLPQFEQEFQQGDYIGGSVTFLKGMRMGGWIGKLPKPILKMLFKTMAKGDDWEENVQLLGTIPGEIRSVLDWDAGLDRYAQLNVPTLILYGTKTTDYLIASAKEIAKFIPNSQLIAMEGLTHNAPDEQAPEQVALQLKKFFANHL